MTGETNAVKAQVIATLNALMGLAFVFGVPLSDAQQGAIIVAANALFGLYVALTYTRSHKRRKGK